MALAMNTTITVSCEAAEEKSGPTIVHSTGVQNYRIQPELIRVLQESCGNDRLCDHEKGVQCTHPPAHIIDVFKSAGFTLTSVSTAGSRKLWMLTKTSNSGPSVPSKPAAPSHPDKNPAKGNAEDEQGEGEEEPEEEPEPEAEPEEEEEE
jgi:hypothetical protein